VNVDLQAVLLGVIQGLAEFLPISSSGHLVLAQQWLGDAFVFQTDAVAFDLVLHLGTLLPVLHFYRADLLGILRQLLDGNPAKHPGGPLAWAKADRHRWLALMVVVASVPTGLIGVTLKDTFEALFHSVGAVCVGLGITGALLLATRALEGRANGRELGIATALLIGLAQGVAITPGISRSGTTIATALMLGIRREDAARFSFLLSIPAILGAVLLQAKEGVTISPGAGSALLVGFAVSMAVGYASLRMLVALVKVGGLHRFAYYVWPVAIGGYLALG
jgi:undecaprenyl-diphosphatase